MNTLPQYRQFVLLQDERIRVTPQAVSLPSRMLTPGNGSPEMGADEQVSFEVWSLTGYSISNDGHVAEFVKTSNGNAQIAQTWS